jgi:hypothetical protein
MQRNTILRVVFFWVILAGLLTGIEYVIQLGVRNCSYAQYAKVNIVAGHKAKPQIAIFGSSVGEVGVNARMINDTLKTASYNFSIDGTRFMQYKGLIQELNDYDDSCRLVIFAENFFTLTPIDQLTEVDRYIAHINNDHIYESLHQIQPELVWKLRNVPFYKLIAMKHSYFKAALIGLKDLRNGQKITDPYLGYTPRDIPWQADMDSLNRIGKIRDVIVDTAIFNDYKTIVQQLQKKGRKVLIMIPPVYKEGLRLLQNLEAERTAFKSLEGNGVYFIDYSNCILSQDKKYFYNNSHLNSVGADYFTQMLVGDIQKILTVSSGNQGELGSNLKYE